MLPTPACVPPHDPGYQYHDAPVPAKPPLTVNADGEPSHIVSGNAVAVVAVSELSFTVIVSTAQFVVLQTPSPRT